MSRRDHHQQQEKRESESKTFQENLYNKKRWRERGKTKYTESKFDLN